MDMDKNKNANKNTNKNAQKGMNRTEFAQEYSLDTGKTNKNANKNNTQFAITYKVPNFMGISLSKPDIKD